MAWIYIYYSRLRVVMVDSTSCMFNFDSISLLQIISNDEYKSVEHRVLANPFQEPRVSVAIFFNPGQRENLYGPLPELISDEKPAVYREFMFNDYMGRFFSKELDGKTLTNYYRISN